MHRIAGGLRDCSLVLCRVSQVIVCNYLMMANSVFMGNIQLYTAVPQPTCTLADLYDEFCQN